MILFLFLLTRSQLRWSWTQNYYYIFKNTHKVNTHWFCYVVEVFSWIHLSPFPKWNRKDSKGHKMKWTKDSFTFLIIAVEILLLKQQQVFLFKMNQGSDLNWESDYVPTVFLIYGMDNDVKKHIALRHHSKEHKDESGLVYRSANCCSLSVAPLDLILLISAPVVFKVQNGATS